MNLMKNDPEYMRGPCPAPTEFQRQKVRELVAETKKDLKKPKTKGERRLAYSVLSTGFMSSRGTVPLERIDSKERTDVEGTYREYLHQMLDDFLNQSETWEPKDEFRIRPYQENW